MKKGLRYVITMGEYSDYRIEYLFVALKDFSFDKALGWWIKGHGWNVEVFFLWLRTSGFVADDTINEIHLDDLEPRLNIADDAGDEP